MRLYVIRHGESEANRQKIFTGWLDVHLTEEGKAQARQASAFLQNLTLDKIYASDLCRARETAEAALPGCIYETCALAREISVGDLMEKPLNTLTQEQMEATVTEGYAPYRGESKEDLRRRVRGFLTMLEGREHQSVALFTHGGWLRCLLETVLDTYLPRKNLCCTNCMVAVFEYTGDVWRLHSWINPL